MVFVPVDVLSRLMFLRLMMFSVDLFSRLKFVLGGCVLACMQRVHYCMHATCFSQLFDLYSVWHMFQHQVFVLWALSVMALNLETDDVGVVIFGDDHDIVEVDSCKSTGNCRGTESIHSLADL